MEKYVTKMIEDFRESYELSTTADTPAAGNLFDVGTGEELDTNCLLYTSPSPRDLSTSRMPSSA